MNRNKILIRFLFIGSVSILLLMMSGFASHPVRISNGEKNNIEEVGTPETAWIWDLSSSPIFIDDTDPNFNWSKTAAENPWCSGAGISSNPYVIHDVRIIGDGSENCITIVNSKVHFRIIDSVIYNEKVSLHNNGIYFYNVTNGDIVNNYIYSDGQGRGIELYECEDNIIYGNTIENHKFGLIFFQTNHSVISLNTVVNNINGISVTASEHNDITWNDIIANSDKGLELDQKSNYNLISLNTFSDNLGDGLWIWLKSDYNTIDTNGFANNDRDVIEGMSCTGNTFVDNGDYSHYLVDDVSSSGRSEDNEDDDDDGEDQNDEKATPLFTIDSNAFLIGLIIAICGIGIIVSYFIISRFRRQDYYHNRSYMGYQGSFQYSSGTHFLTINQDKMPPGLLRFIHEQNDSSGIIKKDNLPKNLRNRGVQYCRFEISQDGVALYCYKR